MTFSGSSATEIETRSSVAVRGGRMFTNVFRAFFRAFFVFSGLAAA